eukprot:10082551-Karenia_brevis.AAC.1
MSPVTDVSVDEIKRELGNMRKGKAADVNGVVMEMLLHGSDALLGMISDLFNAILQPNALPPSAWRETMIKVIFKKGDVKLPENYRPICILPILYKLFSRVLLARIGFILDSAQTVEQAGFRAGFSVDDHLFTIVSIIDQLAEFNLPMWVCAIDFCKAFDTVAFQSIWGALLKQSVPHIYVNTLRNIYQGQVGKVVADRTNKPFRISRGTKQGDPMSPVVFNSVLQEIFNSIQPRWELKHWGIQIGDRCLTNLRFADDVLLVATSRRQLNSMIHDLASASKQVGLSLHMGKTKILTNVINADRSRMKVARETIEVLPYDRGTKYLGRYLSLDASHHDRELDHRIQVACGKFAQWRHELCSKHYSFRNRLRLFNSIITPTILFGCKSWIMTADRERKLRSTQRRMLRNMAGTGRRRTTISNNEGEYEEVSVHSGTRDSPTDESSNTTALSTEQSEEEDELESYTDWIKRATRLAEDQLRKAGLEDWVLLQRRWKMRWAGHTARRSDGRWAKQVLTWTPVGGHRRPGHPLKRWQDSIDGFIGRQFDAPKGLWMTYAQDRSVWNSLEIEFIKTDWSR